MDRRTLLKSGAAVPAVALMPASIQQAVAAIEPPVPIQPLNIRPYANYVWEWMVSNDGETYYEGFSTKEEAIEFAKHNDYSLLAECVKQDFRLDVDGWRIIEQLNDDNMELIGESEGIECTHEQSVDLEKMVQRAIEAWVVKHNINITAWSFAGVQNEDGIPEA